MGGYSLNRKGKPIDAIEDQLHGIFKDFLSWNDTEFGKRRKMAHSTALKANWKDFFQAYLLAYEKAMTAAENRSESLPWRPGGRRQNILCRHRIDTASLPAFTAVTTLPQTISRLRELATIYGGPGIPSSRPVRLPVAQNMAGDEQQSRDDAGDPVIGNTARGIEEPSYLNLYTQIMKQFDDYVNDREASKKIESIRKSRGRRRLPIFSTEYGS